MYKIEEATADKLLEAAAEEGITLPPITPEEALNGFYDMWGEIIATHASEIYRDTVAEIAYEFNTTPEAIADLEAIADIYTEAAEGLHYQATYYSLDRDAFQVYLSGLIGREWGAFYLEEGGAVVSAYVREWETTAVEAAEKIEAIGETIPAENYRTWEDLKSTIPTWAAEIRAAVLIRTLAEQKKHTTPEDYKALKAIRRKPAADSESGFSLLETVATLAIGLTIIGAGASFYIAAAEKLETRAAEIQQIEQQRLDGIYNIIEN